jgi:hypothetical protein
VVLRLGARHDHRRWDTEDSNSEQLLALGERVCHLHFLEGVYDVDPEMAWTFAKNAGLDKEAGLISGLGKMVALGLEELRRPEGVSLPLEEGSQRERWQPVVASQREQEPSVVVSWQRAEVSGKLGRPWDSGGRGRALLSLERSDRG